MVMIIAWCPDFSQSLRDADVLALFYAQFKAYDFLNLQIQRMFLTFEADERSTIYRQWRRTSTVMSASTMILQLLDQLIIWLPRQILKAATKQSVPSASSNQTFIPVTVLGYVANAVGNFDYRLFDPVTTWKTRCIWAFSFFAYSTVFLWPIVQAYEENVCEDNQVIVVGAGIVYFTRSFLAGTLTFAVSFGFPAYGIIEKGLPVAPAPVNKLSDPCYCDHLYNGTTALRR
ncbi:hypothetical protein BV898_08774 [Hypsibius exemplaris]|uniref:Uncharacterized protein n=1 Tax=Hypsibius exemplaris TaxID=2072580 RepID=A0A1W0WPB9_HYPEX|nr:hypothetical protein BV898_08774 [Hypsibius exemplaris]